jgi:hypothetical protein
MTPRLEQLIVYVAARAAEPSTWQGVAFMLTLCGSHYASSLDWGQAAALGGFISGAIKIIFPDVKPPQE